MNKYCNKLELPFPPLREGYDLFRKDANHYLISLNDMNHDIQNLLSEKGLSVPLIEVFYRKPRNISSIHTDNEGGDFVKINWVYYGSNSIMSWFSIKENSEINKTTMMTTAGTPYLRFTHNEVTLEHSVSMQGSYLVQVGVPHQVINPKEERYCLSFVLRKKDSSIISMQDALHLLAEFIS